VSRGGSVSLWALAGLHVAACFAGFIAPYGPARQNRDAPFTPPSRLHFVDTAGNFHVRPFLYRLRARPDGSYEEDRAARFPLRFLTFGDQYAIAGNWSSNVHLFGVEAPAGVFLMGTDDLGRDQFSRFLHGARISLFIGPAAAILALAIGFLVGAAAGFYGRRVDEFLMAMAELFLSLPWLYLLLGARALLPLDVSPAAAFTAIAGLLGAIGWARPARIVRSVVMMVKKREFVMAARGFGATDLYLLRSHIAPHTRGVLLAQAALLIPQYILAEVTMSFLGVGVSEPAASWGLLLAPLQRYHALVAHWWMWLPALLLIPIFGAYYALAAALGGFGGAEITAR
jgi:peptide/nickel transport system permease protein